MSEIVEFFGQTIEVRRRRYQKRLGVSVYPNGEIRVSANKSVGTKAILRFLESNKNWLEKSLNQSLVLQEKYPLKFFKSGEEYPYLGSDYKLRFLQGDSVGVKFSNEEILFTSSVLEPDLSEKLREKYFKSFKKSYRQVAETLMTERLHFYSQEMKLKPTGVQFRGQKSIWGSCSHANKISLNFKLIVAPLEVVDYVIVHELAHIRHKNHSASFWKLVEQYTDHRHFSRHWLRENQFKADFLAAKPELARPAP